MSAGTGEGIVGVGGSVGGSGRGGISLLENLGTTCGNEKEGEKEESHDSRTDLCASCAALDRVSSGGEPMEDVSQERSDEWSEGSLNPVSTVLLFCVES